MSFDAWQWRGSWLFETVRGREAAVERTRMYRQRVSSLEKP